MHTQMKPIYHFFGIGWSKLGLALLFVLAFCSTGHAALISGDFTGKIETNTWVLQSYNGYPCLTAGTTANSSGTVIPPCNLSTPDASGSGALRLTPASTYQHSAIVTSDTYPSNQGLQVTFTAYVWGGDRQGSGKLGADGISFFIQDGAVPTTLTLPDGTTTPNLGSTGGSLGYSCSNGNVGSGYTGLTGAYLGLGIDEYGNFLNTGDNTSSGIAAQTSSSSSNGYNSWGSGTYQSNRIGLRGAGNTSWYWLNKNYPQFYPSTLSADDRKNAVKKTCQNGYLVDTTSNGWPLKTAILNYAAIPGGYWVLPETQPLAIESATKRSDATPITYKLQITPSGYLSFWYSYNGGTYQPVLSNWNMTTSNGAIPSTVRFGFAGSTGGSHNNHDLTCFIAEPVTANSGAGANTVQAGQVRTGTQVYTASYDPNFWTGSLISSPISSTSTGLVVSTPTWDGSCVLTGGICSTTGVSVATAQGSGSRTLITWNGTAGTPFTWSSLTTAQKAVLNSTDSGGQDRLNWLRGARDKEQTATPPGALRARASVLGDIVDSSPTWIGPPSMPYGSTFTDKLYSTTGPEGSYTTFASNLSQRLNVVYAGSNDGILHGFQAGANDANGNYSSTLNDGKEVIGIIPSSALATSDIANLTNPTYNHSYFADASPGTGDLYYAGAWHTWLVSGLGPGGQEILVADITDPLGSATGTTAFAESNAASILLNSITPAALTAATCVNAITNCGDNLGNTYGTPLVRRLHNGKWAIIFGNGYGSSSKHAGVYIGLVNSSTGALSYYWLDTPYTTGQTNGIAYVSSADLDGDRVADYLYAGDLLGNVWRFDLTSSNPADWAASKFGQPTAAPLFTTPSAQPITTQVVPTITLSAGAKRVLLGFGTGKNVPFTSSSPAGYASGTQSIYGIWDWDMASWNTGRTTANSVVVPASSLKLASLAQVTTTPYRTFSASDLLANSVASTAVDGLSATSKINTVCWNGSTACPSTNNTSTSNNQYGWKFDLPYSGEQLIYSPVFQGGILFVNTTVPPAAATLGACTPSLPTGWSRGFDMASGGGAKQNVFPDSSGSLTVANGSYSITAIKLNAVGKPYIVAVGSKLYGVSQTVGGRPTITRFNPQGGVTVKRVSWQQLR